MRLVAIALRSLIAYSLYSTAITDRIFLFMNQHICDVVQSCASRPISSRPHSSAEARSAGQAEKPWPSSSPRGVPQTEHHGCGSKMVWAAACGNRSLDHDNAFCMISTAIVAAVGAWPSKRLRAPGSVVERPSGLGTRGYQPSPIAMRSAGSTTHTPLTHGICCR